MDASVRRMARAGPRSTRRAVGRLVAVTMLVAGMLSGCGAQPSPAEATPAPTALPSTDFADTLRVGGVGWDHLGMEMDLFRQASGRTTLPWYVVHLGSVVYSRLYRWDARFDVVPDLADGPCTPQGDGTVIRCHLVDTTFHDGTPLTADDVAYSFRLFQRDTVYNADNNAGGTGSLDEVQVVDPRTVDFVLPSVDPTFLTMALPMVPILSRRAVEAAYAAFVTRTKNLDAAALAKLADAIDDEAGRDPPVCSPRVDEAARMIEQIGVHLYREDFSRTTGTFEPCTYVGAASAFIRQAAIALGSTGLDAVAAAFQLLSTDWQPIGTGPYRFVSESADLVRAEAWPGHHGGLAATRFIDFVPTTGDGSDLANGAVDLFQIAYLGPAYQATAAAHGVRVATPAEAGYYALMFNMRPGRLFADIALRRALQLCIDLPRDVDAASGGSGIAVYGPVIPGSWADEPNLPKPDRDPAAARQLIEGAGWQLGADGVYAKDGVRLAATIPVRAEDWFRTKIADLIAKDAGDCGMDLEPAPTSWDVLRGLLQYPHNVPGSAAPFDLYIGVWITDPDPSTMPEFMSSHVSDAEHPDEINFTGFTDPVVDRLVAAAMATYDQAERASLYRQAQQELAAQVPYIFLWAFDSYDIVRAAVATVDGPLDLAAPYWAWQPERLVVAASGP